MVLARATERLLTPLRARAGRKQTRGLVLGAEGGTPQRLEGMAMRSTAGAGIPESLDRTIQAGNSPELLA